MTTPSHPALPRAARLAVVLALQAGCSQLIALPPGLPAEGRVVREVEVVGAKEVDEEELVDGLEMHSPTGNVDIKYNLYDVDAVATDRLRIQSYYQKHGFFSARVSGVDAVPVRDRYMDLIFRVVEGVPTTIKSIGIGGVPSEPAGLQDRTFAAVEITIGDRYSEEEYLAAKSRVARVLAEAGYAFADVTGQVLVDRTRHVAAIRLRVEAGPRVTLHEPSLSGPKYYPLETLRKRIAWIDGEIYSPQALAATRRNILALQNFSTVRVDLGDPASDVAPVISAIEAQRNELRLGGGVAVDPLTWRVRGRAGYIRRGFLGALNTLTIDLRPAYAFPALFQQTEDTSQVQGFVGELLAAIDRVDFPADFFQSRVQVGYQVDEVEAFSTQGPQFRLETSRRLVDERIRFVVGWGFNYDTFQSRVLEADEAAAGIPDHQRVGFYHQRLVIDFRDQLLAPTRGFFAELNLEEGTPFAGGEDSYIRFAPEGRGYVPVFCKPPRIARARECRLVLAARVFGGTDLLREDLPVTRRFFSGGASRHRGFPQRTLSPTARLMSDGVTPVAIGGSSALETNLEARFRVYGRYGMVLFTDGGDVQRDVGDIDVTNLHWAVGLGLRIQTLIGPVRIDLGFRVNRLGGDNPRPNDRFAFHLSLGEAF